MKQVVYDNWQKKVIIIILWLYDKIPHTESVLQIQKCMAGNIINVAFGAATITFILTNSFRQNAKTFRIAWKICFFLSGKKRIIRNAGCDDRHY